MMSNNEPQLDKSIWTHDDFETMGWHDCSIYGINFLADTCELVLDIDYIFKWVNQGPTEGYRFWVSPATLIFQNVNGWKGTIEIWTGLPLTPVIMGVRRSVQRNSNLAGEPWNWIVELGRGQLEFHAEGFTQFTRAKPILQSGQSLKLETRGGVSFSRPKSF